MENGSLYERYTSIREPMIKIHIDGNEERESELGRCRLEGSDVELTIT